MANKTKIVVGMSGGVDSAVSASLLAQGGFEPVGVSCKFIDDEHTEHSIKDAKAICDTLKIPHVVYDCVDTFKKNVVDPFVQSYVNGQTPNPCVSCNANTKLPSLIQAANELQCDKIATGHYARIAQVMDNSGSNRCVVKTALDNLKDQSYMLSMLSQDILSRLILPLGAVTKAEVRVIAKTLGLCVADKEDSQDICFAADGYRSLLRLYGICEEPGQIVDSKGNVLGVHSGLSNYTLGQRKGLGIAAPKPYYVIDKNIGQNRLVVGFEDETLVDEVIVGDANWQAFENFELDLSCMVKLRYKTTPQACSVYPIENSLYKVILKSPATITAPGQCAVFMLGTTVLGSATIKGVRRCDK